MTDPALVRNRGDLRQAGSVTRWHILVRLVDQGFWSAAFFGFNLIAATLLSVADFASLTVCTSIGVISAAAVRSLAVDGRVIAGSRNKLVTQQSVERWSMFFAGLSGAAVAALVSLCWLVAGSALTEWWLPLLAGVIVLADGPHYLATVYGLFLRAAIMAGSYVILAGTAAALSFTGIALPVGSIWVACLFVVWIVGLSGSKSIPWRNSPFPKADVTIRLTAESLYSALGGQLGILIIFLTSPPDDTAGIRLAYSLIYAPVFMIIQGLSPIFLTKIAQLHVYSDAGRFRLLKGWVALSVGGTILSGFLGLLLSVSIWKGSNFEHVGPFLVPVGAAMVGSFVLDSALLLFRFSVAPKITHRIRLFIVTVDVAAQLCLSLAWGSKGLVYALFVGFGIKVLLGIVIYRKIRTRSTQTESIS